MPRPLFSKSIVELEALGADPMLPTPQLRELFDELQHRATSRAVALRVKAAKLLTERDEGKFLALHAAAAPAPLIALTQAPSQPPPPEASARPSPVPSALSLKLSRMEWSARARTFFTSNTMQWLGELAATPWRKIVSSRGLGRKTIDEMRTRLQAAGLDFDADVGTWTPEWAAASAPKTPPQPATPESDRLGDCLHARVRKVAASDRNAIWVRRRLGWAGGEPETLEEIGGPEGVSRERVRQVVAKAQTALSERFGPPGRLQAAIDLAAELSPCTDATLLEAMATRGIDDGQISSSGLKAAAELFGLPWPFVRCKVGESDLILPAGAERLPLRINTFAKRAAAIRGCVVIDRLTDLGGETLSEAARARLARLVIANDPAWRALDEDKTWWWRPDQALGRRNRLVNTIRKILAVAQEIRLPELRDAVRRPHRSGHFSPPLGVLAKMCGALEGVAVEDGLVRADPARNWSAYLSASEIQIRRLFLSNGPLLSSEQIRQLAPALGLSAPLLAVAKTYSPLLWRPRSGYYALVGASLAPGILEDLPTRRVRGDRNCIHEGWLADGRIALAYRLSEAILRSGILSISSGYRSILCGRYALCVDRTEPIGSIEVRVGGTAWNFSRALRTLGAEANDAALILFDPKASRVTLWVGGRELTVGLAAGRLDDIVRSLEAAPPEDEATEDANDDADD